VRFLIVPADLESRQLLIYSWMYKHSNQTKDSYEGLNKNEVYASARMISKYTDIPHSTVTRQLLKMEVENYIKCIFKSKTDKVSSKYFLTFNSLLNEPVNEPVVKPVHEPASEPVQTIENKGFEGYTEPVHEPACEPVNEPEHEPISSNTNLVIESSNRINIINSMQAIRKLYPGKANKGVADKKLPKLIKEYGEDQLIKTIERYDEYVLSQRKGEFPGLNYKNEGTFWNTGYVDYLDENYEESKESVQVKKTINPWANIES